MNVVVFKGESNSRRSRYYTCISLCNHQFLSKKFRAIY